MDILISHECKILIVYHCCYSTFLIDGSISEFKITITIGTSCANAIGCGHFSKGVTICCRNHVKFNI